MNSNLNDGINMSYLDALCEIGNIGGGKAATALSDMIGLPIRKELPEVIILDYNTAMNQFGKPDDIGVAVLSTLTEGINGFMMYLANLDFINIMLESILGYTISDYSELSEIDISLLKETGNILIASYANAVSQVIDSPINISIPHISINMIGAILNVPLVEYGQDLNKAIFIKERFIINNVKTNCNFMLIPDVESIDKLMKKLGV